MEKLKEYKSKRNFAVTPEPKGRITRGKSRVLKFCVQYHEARAKHYDLRLELGGVALSWAIPKGPSFNTADKRLAVRVEDHPTDYMDFEGVIPRGEYGGGTVMLWDEGVWTPRSDPEKGLKDGSLKFNLDGKRLKGDWALVRMKGAENDAWLLIKERDGFSRTGAGISRFKRGVRSGKSISEIAKSPENPFKSAPVMLCELVSALPQGGEWVYEIKYDGYRALAFSEGVKTRLLSRNNLDCPAAFAPVADAVTELLRGRSAVLDGEICVADKDGLPDFGALQAYIKGGKGGLGYVVFDLLALDGEDLRPLPLAERKKRLKNLLKNPPETLFYSEHTSDLSARELAALKQKNIEGVVAKNKNSAYSAGRNGDWKKLKFRKDGEFAIGGYTLSADGNLRALLLGVPEGAKLRFSGLVGTGFTSSDRRNLPSEFAGAVRKTPPFSNICEKYKKGSVWTRPVFVAQVEFAEVTKSGVLRQASFKGLRFDKTISEIAAEERAPRKTLKQRIKSAAEKGEKPTSDSEKAKNSAPARGKKNTTVGSGETAGVEITNPQKIMFSDSGITKAELARYYAAVADRMFPYIKNRFLSLVCCPSGIDGEKFFRRHLDGDYAGVSRSSEQKYFYVTDPRAIVRLAQYNAVEFHVWGSRKTSPYKPEIMVFDLDPDEGLPLSAVTRGALDLKSILDGLNLKSFLKTSGGKGYHVVVPFRSGVDGDMFRNFSKRVAELLAAKFPSRYTAVMSKKSRAGKIFIDWQRNGAGATSVAPYSVRARAGAAVSMPVFWEQLPKTPPASVTLRTALSLLGQDPWSDFFAVKSTQTLRS